MACGILVPWSGIKPWPFALEAWSLYHWTTREFQTGFISCSSFWAVTNLAGNWFLSFKDISTWVSELLSRQAPRDTHMPWHHLQRIWGFMGLYPWIPKLSQKRQPVSILTTFRRRQDKSQWDGFRSLSPLGSGETDIGREGHRELLGKRRVSCVDEHGSALVKTEHSVCACNWV